MKKTDMTKGYRTEKDSMGEMEVPEWAYYGAQTARAVENFPIGPLRFPRRFIAALGMIKQFAAKTNGSLGILPRDVAEAIQQAAEEVTEGRWDEHFVVDIFQTGSGTSTNMNANEVIARRATELLAQNKGKEEGKVIHPNDHVNCCQSSNDVIPTAIHLAALDGVINFLIPALNHLKEILTSKSRKFGEVLKIGRTHLQDATPVRLGQEFSGYASQMQHGLERLWAVEGRLSELALGGTAVGTGINSHPEFARRTIEEIADETGLNVVEAPNHFEAQAARDACVELSGALKTVATSLMKIANDIRWLGSGPRCGIGEINLPPTQPGSSIMPGKVNPVMSEMVIQVGAQVLGNDTTITYGGNYGNFELNTMMPVIAHNLLESIELLTNASRTFADRCVAGIEADKDACFEYIEKSLAMCTSLAPAIGYDEAARIAKQAYESGRTVREVALEVSGLSKERLDELLDPQKQVDPGRT